MAATLWTREEETRLVQELRDGLTIDDIATAHQRSPLAILARASRMTPDDLPGDVVQAQARPLTRAQRTQWLREQLHTDPAYDWPAHLGQTRRRRYAEVRCLAPRTGAIWTADEDAQVLAATAAGVANTELAAQLQRSPKSTARRAWRLTQSQARQEDSTACGDGNAEGTGGDGGGGLADSGPTPTTGLPDQAVKPPAPLQASDADTDADTGRAATGTAARSTASLTTTAPGPSAHGQPWSEDETFGLLEELRRGLSTEDIAVAHRRSMRAINGRAATILTYLTGSKHALNDSNADQLRTRLTQTTGTTSNTLTPPTGQSEQDTLDVLRTVLGATTMDA